MKFKTKDISTKHNGEQYAPYNKYGTVQDGNFKCIVFNTREECDKYVEKLNSNKH